MSTASQQHILQGTKGFTFCHWCTQQMPALAKNCPHCQKLRIDIHRAKASFYTLAIVFGLLFIGAAGFIAKMSMENHWWSVKIEKTPISRSDPPADRSTNKSPNLLWGAIEESTRITEGLSIYDPYAPQYKFSVEKFLFSGSGIFLIIFGLVTMAGIGYFGHRVSKKLGTSSWI